MNYQVTAKLTSAKEQNLGAEEYIQFQLQTKIF